MIRPRNRTLAGRNNAGVYHGSESKVVAPKYRVRVHRRHDDDDGPDVDCPKCGLAVPTRAVTGRPATHWVSPVKGKVRDGWQCPGGVDIRLGKPVEPIE
jgi:hypothetical protein